MMAASRAARHPQRVAPGIYWIASLYSNAYLVETGDGLALIDCLTPGHARRILGAVEAIGGAASALKGVWLTHADVDHIGSLADLKAQTGVSVMAHPLAEPYVQVKAVRTFRTNRLMQFLARRLYPIDRLRPTPVDRLVEGGNRLDGWQVIETPGHAPGHISFYHAGQRALIVGDTLMNLRRLRPSIRMITDDPVANAASIRRLAELDVEMAAFGHGPPIAQKAGEIIQQVAAQV
jgi:glyoxylase-like metal-dependent hydrolase (beta-lactamase superfamily II)